MADSVLWGIHAGSGGEADALFLQQSLIAVGWSAMGNLSDLPDEREAFKARMMQTHPATKPGGLGPQAGVLYRFRYEMKVGDAVAYPSKKIARSISDALRGTMNSGQSLVAIMPIVAKSIGNILCHAPTSVKAH